MLKFFYENSEFDAYSQFDTETGLLIPITQKKFESFVPKHYLLENQHIQSIQKANKIIFYGKSLPNSTRFPRRIYFQITRKCNLKCPYCFIKADPDQTHVPFHAIQKIASLMSENGLMEVRLTGGEPTLHPQFWEIVDLFRSHHIYISISTNGLWSPSVLERMCQLQNVWIICSIDGGKEIHNQYRPNSFDQIIKNLKTLKSKNPKIRLRLTTTLTNQNQFDLWELGRICKSLDAESITLIPLRPQVRDESIKSNMLTGAEFKRVIEELIKIKQELGVLFTTTLETEFKKAIHPDPVFRKRFSCAAGREGTNLDYDPIKKEFLVYGCSYSPAVDLQAPLEIRKPFLAGTFPENKVDHFISIWQDDENWKIYRDLSIKYKECKICSYYINHTCTGSCPIQNINYNQIKVEDDILAQLKNQLEHTAEWYCYKKILE